MDKIWDRKSFEVGGHWPLWQGRKKRMTTQNRHKSNAKKKKKIIQSGISLFLNITCNIIPISDKFTRNDISCICTNKSGNLSKCGQQLLGLNTDGKSSISNPVLTLKI